MRASEVPPSKLDDASPSTLDAQPGPRRIRGSSGSPLAWLKSALTHHLQVRRGARGLAVTLESQQERRARRAREAPRPAPREARAKERAPTHSDHRARSMHAALRQAFEAAPAVRRQMRHLATIGHHLERSGSLFVHDLSVPVLTRARRQLDALMPVPPLAGLEALRELLCEAIAAHEQRERQQEQRGAPASSSFLSDDKIEVREISPSDFDDASREPKPPR